MAEAVITARQTPTGRGFHLSPNTMLVYEIEVLEGR